MSAASRSAVKLLFSLAVALGVSVAVLCLAVLSCTAAEGYPNLFGDGFVLNCGGYCPELPEGDLVFFTECDPTELAEGDFVVWRNSAGMRVGRVYSTSESYVTVRGDGYVTALPVSVVLGKATRHNPGFGVFLSAVSENSEFGTAAGIAIALIALISLISDLTRRAGSALAEI